MTYNKARRAALLIACAPPMLHNEIFFNRTETTMAKRKLSKEKLDRYLSLADRDFIGFGDDEVIDSDQDDGITQQSPAAINNLGATLMQRERERINSDLAGGSPQQTPQPSTNVNPLTRSITRDNISTALATQQPVQRSSAPSFIPDEELGTLGGLQLPDRVSNMNPLLFGRANIKRIAQSMLADREETQPGAVDERRPTTPQIELTPDEKLAKRLAEINPTPQSFWKRMLMGALQGGADITPEEIQRGDLSAFGRVVGGAVTRAFPAVDVANQKLEQRAAALRDFAAEQPAAAAKLARRKFEQEIAETRARTEREARDRRRNEIKDALDQAAKLRDDKRAEATQRLSVLKELSADSPKRGELVAELQQIYGINVDESYGLLDKTPDDKAMTEGEIRRRATSEVMAEIGASVEKIARDSINVRFAERDAKLSALLADDKVSNMEKQNARERHTKDREAALKESLDYTASDVESRIRRREQELRKQFGLTEPEQQTPQARSPRRSRGSKRGGKVAQSNEASNTNFAQRAGQTVRVP